MIDCILGLCIGSVVVSLFVIAKSLKRIADKYCNKEQNNDQERSDKE